MKKCAGCDICNSKAPMFELLRPDELAIVNENRYSVRYHPGEIILKQGTKTDHFISLVEGFAKVYIEGHNDRNLILDYIRPWNLVGGPGIYMKEKQHFSIVALEECLVCFIDNSRFQRVLHSNSDFADEYLKLVSKNYSQTLQRMVCLSQKQMHGRIADSLIYLYEHIFSRKRISSLISRKDIADFTSLSKDSTIRILKEFERDGIINLTAQGIEILEIGKLRDISAKG